MTLEEIKVATEEQIEEFRTALAGEIESAETQERLDEIDALMNEIEARKLQLVEERKADLQAVAEGEGETIKKIEERTENTMTLKEIRNSKEYIDAFAEYIKTGNDEEVRSLLSGNVASGVVPVPSIVEDRVRTAWDREGITSLVKKTYLKGNLRIGFEISATGAGVHTEGATSGAGFVAEEQLVLGVVELVPESIKKWITLSDEVFDLKGEEFLDYIYDEVTYQIAKKAADLIIADIEACGTVSTTTSPSVPAVTVTTASMVTVATALAELSDEANNPVIVMNKKSYPTFKALQYANGYGADPFEGLRVLFNDTIAAYTAATTGVTYAIVGDFGQGAQMNFPNGDEINFKFDDLSLAEKDLIKIVGREFVGHGVVAPKAFCKIKK